MFDRIIPVMSDLETLHVWQDSTSYQGGERSTPGVEPREWTLRTKGPTITIHRHIHYPPDTWLLTCRDIGLEHKELVSKTADEAKAEAIVVVREYLLIALHHVTLAKLKIEVRQVQKGITVMKVRVVAAVIVRYGRLFLAQRMPSKIQSDYGFHWECPGGKVEDGETDEKALRRELLEEHGLTSIRRLHPVPICESHFGPPTFPIDLSVTHYRVDLHSDDEPVARDCLGFGWFSREELLGLNLAMCPSLVQHREQLADVLILG